MKIKRGLILITFFLIVLTSIAYAQISCSISAGCTQGVAVMSLYNNAGGHAATGTTYPNILCCNGIDGTNCNAENKAVLLNLWQITNSHAQKAGTIGNNIIYPNQICLSVNSGAISCSDNCSAGKVPIISLAKTDNSHVAGPDTYPFKICCSVSDVISGGDGIPGSLSDCDTQCTDADGCTCPTDCVTNGVVINDDCGGEVSTGTGVCGDGVIAETGESCDDNQGNPIFPSDQSTCGSFGFDEELSEDLMCNHCTFNFDNCKVAEKEIITGCTVNLPNGKTNTLPVGTRHFIELDSATQCANGDCSCESSNHASCSETIAPQACLDEDSCRCLGASGEQGQVCKARAYCPEGLQWQFQKEADESCENDFECLSNVCQEGSCISVNDLMAEASSLKVTVCRIGIALGIAEDDLSACIS